MTTGDLRGTVRISQGTLGLSKAWRKVVSGQESSSSWSFTAVLTQGREY